MALLSRMLEVKKELKKVLSARRYSNPLFLELLTWYSHARIIKVRREKMIIKWKACVQEVLSSVLINTIFKNIWRREALLCDQNKPIGFNFSWPENQPRSQILNKKKEFRSFGSSGLWHTQGLFIQNKSIYDIYLNCAILIQCFLWCLDPFSPRTSTKLEKPQIYVVSIAWPYWITWGTIKNDQYLERAFKLHQFPLDKFAEDSMRLDYILCDAKLLLLESPGWLKIASLVRFNRAAFSLVRGKTQKNSVINNCATVWMLPWKSETKSFCFLLSLTPTFKL